MRQQFWCQVLCQDKFMHTHCPEFQNMNFAKSELWILEEKKKKNGNTNETTETRAKKSDDNKRNVK